MQYSKKFFNYEYCFLSLYYELSRIGQICIVYVLSIALNCIYFNSF